MRTPIDYLVIFKGNSLMENMHLSFRWVCDEESRFYDIVVHKTLNILIKRFSRLLIQKLKAMGKLL